MPELSEAKRALLEKYLHGNLQQRDSMPTAASATPKHAEAEQANQPEGVVAIKSTGSRQPFFFLHGQWKNQAFYCFPLAQGLETDQPFYVLEPYGFDGLAIPPAFEEIAAAHVKSMRIVQPEGPYLLGGWCNGALMAYEIARQLQAQGQRVDLLVLMNSMSLVYPWRYRVLPAVLKLLGKLLRLGEDKQIDWYTRLRRANIYRIHVVDYLRFHYRRLKASLRLASTEQVELAHKAEKTGIAFPRLSSYIPRGEGLRQDYESVFTWLTLKYKPSTLYPGKITFFWSSTDWTTKEPFHIGWRKVEVTNEVEIHVFPGAHMSLVTDQLNLLIDSLRQCLSRTQTEGVKTSL